MARSAGIAPGRRLSGIVDEDSVHQFPSDTFSFIERREGRRWPRFVCPDTAKPFYEESKAARAQVEALLDKYRTNTSTLLALASAAVAFFGFSNGPRQQFFYWISIGFYVLAVVAAFLISMPRPTKVNVAYNTAGELGMPPSIIAAKL